MESPDIPIGSGDQKGVSDWRAGMDEDFARKKEAEATPNQHENIWSRVMRFLGRDKHFDEIPPTSPTETPPEISTPTPEVPAPAVTPTETPAPTPTTTGSEYPLKS